MSARSKAHALHWLNWWHKGILQCSWVRNEHLPSFWLVYRAFQSPVGVGCTNWCTFARQLQPWFVCMVQLGILPCMCGASFSCTDSAATAIVCMFTTMFTINCMQNLFFPAWRCALVFCTGTLILSHEMCYIGVKTRFWTACPSFPRATQTLLSILLPGLVCPSSEQVAHTCPAAKPEALSLL